MAVTMNNSNVSASDRGSWLPVIGVAACLIVIIGGLIYAAATGTLFGAWTFWASIGAAIVALFGLLGLNALRSANAARQELTEPTYLQAFIMGPDPMIITRDSIPVLANNAYNDLAERVGVMGESGMPPTLDRVFAGASSREAASALYRLLSNGVGTETLRVLDEEGTLRAYQIDVTDLGELSDHAKAWRIRDLTGPEPVATYLAEAPVGLATMREDGGILALNDTLARWLGLSSAMRPDRIHDFLADAIAMLDAPKEIGRTHRFDTLLTTRKGVQTPTVAVMQWTELEDGAPIASLALYGHSNIAEKAPKPVAASALLEGIQAGDTFMAAPFAIVELDNRNLGEAVVRRSNPAFQTLTGRAEEGERFADLFTEDKPEFIKLTGNDCDPNTAYEACITGSEVTGIIHTNVYIVCHPRNPEACWAYIVDTSKRHDLQEQLIQSQKMQAIGQLAAGVAHDFNNLLQAIRLNTDELLGRHPVGDPSYLELQRVNSDVMRAAALVKKLLAFSSKQTLRAQMLDVTDTLSDVAVTLRQTLSERVKLDIVHGRDLPHICVDKAQLETVLINLCVNARDAMPDGGNITIRSSQIEASDLPIKSPFEDKAVLIEVEDSGTGMDEETMAKIFEPFFTTKELGKGTGLGLATVYGIVEQSGGHMKVTSKIGEGTTFRIYIPAADPTKAIEVTPKPSAPRAPSNLSGQGTILLVEDEESVRTIAAKTLRKRGYRVIEAGDGEEAYEWLEEDHEPIDLMISDVVMPGMDGPTLLRKGRDLLGEARIVFMSGYAKDDFSELLSEEPDVTFLPKPFTLAQLAEKVKSEIGEAKAA